MVRLSAVSGYFTPPLQSLLLPTACSVLFPCSIRLPAPSPARFTRFLCLRAVVSTTVSVLQASIDVLTQEIADLKVKITENQEAVALMNTEIEEETAERQVLPSNCF